MVIREAIANVRNWIRRYEPLPQTVIDEYNLSRKWGERNHLCYAPNSSMFINTLGMVRPCYANFKDERYPDKSLKEIWLGKAFNEVRKCVGKNDLSGPCEFCNASIKNKNYESSLAQKYDNPILVEEDRPNQRNGIFPKIIEFELSNSCNLECVMCDGNLSSAIRKNREKRAPLPNIYGDSFLEELKEFIPHLRVAEFAGGSPFLIAIYYKIWEMLLADNPACNILITTSANIMNKKVKALLERGKFNFNISIDALSRETYEKIRVNANLEETLTNIEVFNAHCNDKGTNLCLLVCPMRINYQELPKLVKYANQLNVQVHFHTVFKPQHLALWSLPPKELKSILQYLKKFTFEDTTEFQKMNSGKYINLIDQIKVWYEKARIREKEEERREQSLVHNIDKSKNHFRKKLAGFIRSRNGLREQGMAGKIDSLNQRLEGIISTLPESVSPEIIYLELAKYKIEEVVQILEEADDVIIREKAKRIYTGLYENLRDNRYSVKYADDNGKYQLNMEYK